MKKYKIIFYATTPEKREKGLMFTDPIEEDECALFLFPRTGDHCFWNKNVSYPLDLIFCDSSNKVKSIKSMEAQSTEPCKSDDNDIKYVIELIKGASEGIDIGDTLIINNDGDKVYFLNKQV